VKTQGVELSASKVEALVHSADTALSFYLQSQASEKTVMGASLYTVQAMVAYPKTTNTVHRLYDSKGNPTTQPCAHILAVIAANGFNAWPHMKMWLGKTELDGQSWQHKLGYVKAKIAKTHTCKCNPGLAGLAEKVIEVPYDPFPGKPNTVIVPKSTIAKPSETWYCNFGHTSEPFSWGAVKPVGSFLDKVQVGSFLDKVQCPVCHKNFVPATSKYHVKATKAGASWSECNDCGAQHKSGVPCQPTGKWQGDADLTAPVKKGKEAKGLYHAEPLAGVELTGPGTSADWKTHKRDIEAAVSGLYVFEELNIVIDWPKVPTIIVEKFQSERKHYQTTLARNLFDYLALVAMGEARHSGHSHTIPKNRHDAWIHALNFDPRSFLPVLDRLFHEGKWGGSLGGEKWGGIARGAGYFYKFQDKPLLFADHVVDLSHNCSIAFNKGIIFNVHHTGNYTAMLDRKRDGSLISGKHTLRIPVRLGAWLDTLDILGSLEKDPGVVIECVNDPTVPQMGWGTKTFTLSTLGAEHGMSTMSSPVQSHANKGNASEAWPKPRK
jgi:hypothetical protein